MNRSYAAWLSAAALGASLPVSVTAQAAPPPHIRFLDADSASFGSYVGVYGVGFGATKGSVKFGSATSVDVALWTDSLVIARVPAGASTGKVVVRTSANEDLESTGEMQVHAGRVFVVSSNGSDLGAGDETDPFQSLHKALSVVQPGDTVLIRAGSYDEQDGSGTPLPALYLRQQNGGTSTQPITWRGYGAEVPVIRGSRDFAKDSPIVYVDADYVRLARLEISGEGNTSNGLSITGSQVSAVGLDVHGFAGAGVTAENGSGVVLEANVIHDGGTRPNVDHGMIIMGPDSLVQFNEVRDLPNGYGIFLQYQTQTGAKVVGNYVHDVAGGGIGLSRVGGNNDVYNNVVWRAGASQGCMCGLQVAYGSASGETSSGDRIYYNTFAGPSRTALLVADRAGTLELHNNVFGGFKAAMQVEDEASASALSSSLNLWSGLGEDPQFKLGGPWIALADFQTSSHQESESLVADPMFADAEHGNLHLTSDSPAVDLGRGPQQPSEDFDGVHRPQGTWADLGAYELEGGGTPHDGGTGGDSGGGSGGAAGTGGDGGGQSGTGGGSVDQDAGPGGASAAPAGDSAGGCGCSLPTSSSSTGWATALAAAGMAIAIARRSERRRSRRDE